MNEKNVLVKKTFSYLILAFFITVFAFFLYSFVSGIISFGELESWDGKTIATSFASGNGTEDNPYKITNAEEYVYFQSLIEGDTFSSYQEQYYQLGDNIDFGGHEITPIGKMNGEEERIFKGHFDGNGYTLENFVIANPSSFLNENYYALFSKAEDASIYRINFDHYRISSIDDDKAVISLLCGNSINSTLTDLSFHDFTIEGESNNFGLLSGKSSEVVAKKIYLQGKVDTNSSIHYLEDGSLSNVILDINYDGEIVGEVDHLYLSSDDSITILDLFNEEIDSDYYWDLVDSTYKILSRNYSLMAYPDDAGTFAFSIQSSSEIIEHASGIDNDNVYVNDLVSDYNHYMGLNYTEIQNTNGTLPSGENQEIYNDSNLAKVFIRYNSSDINNPDTYGTVGVSAKEQQQNFYYYKRMPITSDGYVEFDLIDNPWAVRPDYLAFNGWVTDYPGAVISLDMDTYTRHVRVPLNGNSLISITFYSSWTLATTVETTGEFGELNTGMQEMPKKPNADLRDYYIYETISGRGKYYPTSDYVYSPDGTKIASGSRCGSGWLTATCSYYVKNESPFYDPDAVYYEMTMGANGRAQFTRVDDVDVIYPFVHYNGGTPAGYFIHSTNATENIYDVNGNPLTRCNGSCYQLLQYSDGEIDENETYYYLATRDTNIFAPNATNSINSSTINVSKPMTITGVNNGVNRSATATIRLNSDWTMNADVRIEFIRLYVTVSTTNVDNVVATNPDFIGNYHNVKIGRGITRNGNYLTAPNFFGGNNSNATSLQKYSLIVESGLYQNGSGVGFTTARNHHVNVSVTLGSDYDRVDTRPITTGEYSPNERLVIYYCYAGSWASNLYNSSSSSNTYDFPAIKTVIKSGHFGKNEADYAAGIYTGGRGKGTHYSLREVTVEGGIIFNLIGGPLSDSSRQNKNDIIINVKGGNINMIHGGAGASDTVGNRIINVTGGTINYSVLGGSNANSVSGNVSNPNGGIVGDTLVYVGGNTVVGSYNVSGTLYDISMGNVFGAGNGRQGESTVGSVLHSNVIIDGNAQILGDVYGGGNYGAVGGNSAGNSTLTFPAKTNSDYEDDGVIRDGGDYQVGTNVKILGGTILGSVYGGGNNNGSGNNNNSRVVNSKVSINVYAGSIDNVYGGSNENGTIFGDVYVGIHGGTITGSVYGGGRGGYSNSSNPGTYVSRNVDVVIGDNSSSSVSVGGSVYGGSALGSVNGVSESQAVNGNYTRVTVHGGTITGSVFGGGQGQETGNYNPHEFGNVFVHINSGNISRVFGGNDSSGQPSAVDIVYLNGGVIGTGFGGGNKTGQPSSDIRLQGSTITGNIYGGSNESGDVTTTHVLVSSGKVVEVFGGNNLGGTSGDSHVLITGGDIDVDIYGGGKNAEASSTDVHINGCSVPTVYGGGQQAGVSEKTKVLIDNGASAPSIFGGSNILGDVTESEVVADSSTVDSIYGGNNLGGSTDTSHIQLSSSTITDVYGGGFQAETGESHISIESGVITNVYGGGNQAGVGSSELLVEDGQVTNLFGGSNESGLTDSTSITTTGGEVLTLYGGGNSADVGETTLNLKSLTSENIYGGGNQAKVLRDVSLTINDSKVTESLYGGGNAAGVDGNVFVDLANTIITSNIFGGGNNGSVQGNTDVYITDGEIHGNSFAGGNGETAIVYGNSTITVDGNTVLGDETSTVPNAGCLFGSGNAASTGVDGSSVKGIVNLVGGEVFGNVYGGPKKSTVYGVTETNIGMSAVADPTGLNEESIIIHGTVFGGGESNDSGDQAYDYTFISVTEGITVTINGEGYLTHGHDLVVNGSIFGSGNASSSSGDSNIYIKKLGSKEKPNQAISVQRATNLEIDESVIELFGTTDRTNEYSDILYSFNLIDKLTIKNGTTLLLRHNANMLKEFYSGVDVDGELVKAEVKIDADSKKVTKNVDNRIYMSPGQNLHITLNQAATIYGKVSGMTFFGMYTSNGETYRFGLYDSIYEYGSVGDIGLQIAGGSYVIGLRNDNHDIKVDGFYTNYLDEENFTDITVDYITPSPIGETGYRWIIGFDAITYTVPLIVSKYYSLGTSELALIDFTSGNTTFNVISFDSSGLDPDVELVDSESVPKIADTEEEANRLLGLAMKTETQEWTSTTTTKFMSADGGYFTGDSSLHADARDTISSLMFYAYHAKNFNREGSLGSVVIMMQALIPKNEIEYDIKFIAITVELEAKNYEDSYYYDAAITYHKQYVLPASTAVNITNQGQFTAYFSLTQFIDDVTDIYGRANNNYHALTLSSPLPVGTFITMLDSGSDISKPEYYYLKITDDIYQQTVEEYDVEGEASYPLRWFVKMDSTSPGNTYDDVTANPTYYKEDQKLIVEEFIFIVDLKDTTLTGTHLDNHISLELRNSDDWPVVNVVPFANSIMNYSTYDAGNEVISQTFQDVDTYLYYDVPDDIKYSTNISYELTENKQPIIDTNYEYSAMGMTIVFYDSNGDIVSSSLLSGTSFLVGEEEYFADWDGVFRVNIADKVTTIDKDLHLIIDNNLPSGKYRIAYTLFASEDGLHNSNRERSVTEEFDVNVVSGDNYISVDTDDETKLVYGDTYLNQAGSKINHYKISYLSKLEQPNLRVSIYKRNTDIVNSNEYTLVAFTNLFVNDFGDNNDYVTLPLARANTAEYDFTLADNILSGTYKVVFGLYDNDQVIDEDIEYVIVQKKIE